MIATQMCERERKSRGGRGGGGWSWKCGDNTFFLPRIGTLPAPQTIFGAVSGAHSLESMAHKKLRSVQCLVSEELQDFFQRQLSGSEVKLRQCFLPPQELHDTPKITQFVFGVKGCPTENRHQRSRNWRNEDRGTPAGSKLRTLPICCPSGRRLRRPLDIKLFFTWSISQ